MKYALLMGLLAAGSGTGLHAWLEFQGDPKLTLSTKDLSRPEPSPAPEPTPVAEPEARPVDHRLFSRSAVGWRDGDRMRESAEGLTGTGVRPSHQVFSRAGVEWRHEREEVRP